MGSSAPEKDLPEGWTLKDLLEWVQWGMKKAWKAGREGKGHGGGDQHEGRHSRGFGGRD